MKQEGSLGVSRYVQFVLVVEVLKDFACLHLVVMQLTATSLIDPLVIAPSLPKPAIALVAISEIFTVQKESKINILISSAKCEREEKRGISVSRFGFFFFILFFVYNFYFSVFIKFHYQLSSATSSSSLN